MLLHTIDSKKKNECKHYVSISYDRAIQQRSGGLVLFSITIIIQLFNDKENFRLLHILMHVPYNEIVKNNINIFYQYPA